MDEFVILVNESDEEVGIMEKMEVHEKGLLHRAFSIFIFNSNNELLIHRRADHKYHSAGLWTNTCCSHPRQGESVREAASRRLMEEMGMDCDLEKIFTFIYKAPLENELTEHELDHVLVGVCDDEPDINPEEVSEYKYIKLNRLSEDIERHPDTYTAWFKICIQDNLSKIQEALV